jgi:hypothetical protein
MTLALMIFFVLVFNYYFFRIQEDSYKSVNFYNDLRIMILLLVIIAYISSKL